MRVTTVDRPPMIATEVSALHVQRLSPTFVRVELGGPGLAEFGVDGELYDQRIKLVFPSTPGALPPCDAADEAWFATWSDIPVEQRGHMRTYSVREARGTVFLEVPNGGDVLDVPCPAGVRVVWLVRNGADHGARQIAAVRVHLGLRPDGGVADVRVDPDLWETPSYSSSGEEVPADPPVTRGLYAWIAGESKVVTVLRRCLVTELGMDRSQVAFMGYWRRGVAMRS